MIFYHVALVYERIFHLTKHTLSADTKSKFCNNVCGARCKGLCVMKNDANEPKTVQESFESSPETIEVDHAKFLPHPHFLQSQG